MKSNPGFQAYKEAIYERCNADDPRAVSALGDVERYQHLLRDLISYPVPSNDSLLGKKQLTFEDVKEGQVLLVRQRSAGRSRYDLQVIVAEKHIVDMKVLPIRVRIARSSDDDVYREWEQYIYSYFAKHGHAVLRYTTDELNGKLTNSVCLYDDVE
jgi:hypothetical protein